MRSTCVTCILTFMVSFLAVGQKLTDRDIAIKITPYKNVNVYLANYFGTGKNFADTAWLDGKSEGHFKSKRKLTPGMYFVVSPQNRILFEFLLDSLQHFNISADTAKLNNVTITGSAENDLFNRYVTGVAIIAQQIEATKLLQSNAKTRVDRDNVQALQVALAKKLQHYKDSVVYKNPTSLTALLIVAGKQPELPMGTVVKTKSDTIRAVQYLEKHYWDNVPFNDDRLLYTPFFEAKIDAYYSLYTSHTADSVIKNLQYMLLYARTGKEMYPYLLTKFTNRYLNPEYTGQNKVFLYLFNEFFMKGDTTILDARSKKIVFDRAYQLMANQVGDPAPSLAMTDVSGKAVSLYSTVAPYTMLIFWDPSCEHCKQEIPYIDSIYRTRWKALGIKIFSVNINSALTKDMLQFAKDKKLDPGWILTYQTDGQAKAIADKGQLNYPQLYDIYQTPTLYLLDAQKHIMAKHLSIEQFEALMKVKNALK